MKESENLELKKSLSQLDEALKSICAFLNHKEGKLYFGIDDTGRIIGQVASDSNLRKISQQINSRIKPEIIPEVKDIFLENKPIIKIIISKGINIPYFLNGIAYKRIGTENRIIPPDELKKIIIEQKKTYWDQEICEDADFSDISIETLKWFLKESNRKFHTFSNSLDKLGLLKKTRLLNASVMLFGKKPEKFFSNAKLRCAIFATVDTSLIIDRQEFNGNLFYLIKKAEEYILKNIHIGMKIEGLQRIDIPEINKEAFREAIINAFCHRDYNDPDSVNIAVFKYRIEIRNPGSLYGGLTIDQIKKEMVSKRRNELIANIFHDIHFVEKWGREISLILSKEPKTEFKVIAGIFIASFMRKEKTVGKILDLIKESPKITRQELSNKTGLSIRGIEYNLKKLKSQGKLKRIGPAKGGYWKVK